MQENKSLYSIECEQVILGLLIKNNNLFDFVEEIINEDCFYEMAHQLIFSKLKTAISQGIKMDDLTLEIFFENNNILKQIHGKNYISVLINMSIGIFDITDYAKIVKDLYIKRKLKNLALQINEIILKDDLANEILNDFKLSLDQIEDESTDFEYNLKAANELIENKLNELTNIIENHIENTDLIKTNFVDFDYSFGGIPKQALTILAGRPSMGKSTLALNIALNVAKQNKKVLFFSQEMSNNENTDKILANFSQINSTRIRDKRLTIEDIQLMIKKQDKSILNNLFIDDKAKVNRDYIKRTIKRFKRKHGSPDLIIVDHLQIAGDSQRAKNKIEELGNITADFKNLAKKENCAFILLSQLSRAVEARDNKRPELSDLRDSGEIEQNADLVMFVYRDDYYLSKELLGLTPEDKKYKKLLDKFNNCKNICEVMIKKYRNGKCGYINLLFTPETSTFKNLTTLLQRD